jgi:hypothetical protein
VIQEESIGYWTDELLIGHTMSQPLLALLEGNGSIASAIEMTQKQTAPAIRLVYAEVE